MSTTPETQAAILESCGQLSFALREKMETLERERNAARAENEAMREVIKEASSHLSAFLGFYSDSLTLPQMRSLSECISKLQPFLTEPQQ